MKKYFLLILGLLIVGMGCNSSPQKDSTKEENSIVTTNNPTTILNWKSDGREDAGSEKFEQITFDYPSSYEVLPPGHLGFRQRIYVVKYKDNLAYSHLEIFQLKDRPKELDKDCAQLEVKNDAESIGICVPKEKLKVMIGKEKFDVWLYFPEDDEAAKLELLAIVNSIRKNIVVENFSSQMIQWNGEIPDTAEGTEKFKEFTFQYPESYAIDFINRLNENGYFPLILEKKDVGKLEIYEKDRMKIYLGFEAEKLVEERKNSGFGLKEIWTVKFDQEYEVWLSYKKDDEQTKQELHKILNSFKKS